MHIETNLIPTDHAKLVEYLRTQNPADRWVIADALATQLGGSPYETNRAQNLVADAISEIDRADSAVHQPAATLIPTDDGALTEYLRKLTPAEQCLIADRLSAQLGNTPEAIGRAADMVERALRKIANGADRSRPATFQAPAAPGFLDLVAMIRVAADRARPTTRTDISQADALTLLYAAVTGQNDGPGRAARRLLPLHLVLPGTGQPHPDCTICHGTGETPATDDLGPRHCHCRCDLCMCNDALCNGPCETVGVLLEELVLHGLPAGAIDVARTLAMLQVDGIHRIVAQHTGQVSIIVDPINGDPGAAQVTVCNKAPVDSIGKALRTEGFWCDQRTPPDHIGATRLYVTPLY